MHLDLALILGSAVVGLLVGMTGTGGGALMTPMLVLLFGVAPSAAISSDLVAALLMKPAGVAIHWRRHTVHAPIVRHLGHGARAEHVLQILLGAALVSGSAAMMGRAYLTRH